MTNEDMCDVARVRVLVLGGRTTLNLVRVNDFKWVYTTGASPAPDSSTLSSQHNRHVYHAHGPYTQENNYDYY